MLPYIVRAGRLYTFWNLESDLGPFEPVVETGGEVLSQRSRDWWKDQDLSRWYVDLLNRALNKLTGRLGLNFDRDHQRYYFDPELDEDGQALAVERTYRALNRDQATRSVVWRPIRKKTDKPRNYWIHLAVGLRFHRVDLAAWALSIRPERRFTRDGTVPLVPKATGRRATSTKSHMYNYDVLGEVQFWKDFLSQGTPFIEFDFGGQNLIVSSTALSASVSWPGIAGDEKAYENVYAEFDLFSAQRYQEAVQKNERPDAEIEYWELADLGDLEQDDP